MPADSSRIKECPELLTVSRRAGRAIGDYNMIQAGDRIAVAVSGGKDSISLLHLLRHRQSLAPINFEFAAVHVDFEFEGAYDFKTFRKSYFPKLLKPVGR